MPGYSGPLWPTHRVRETRRRATWRVAKKRAARERAAAARESRAVNPAYADSTRLRWG